MAQRDGSLVRVPSRTGLPMRAPPSVPRDVPGNDLVEGEPQPSLALATMWRPNFAAPPATSPVRGKEPTSEATPASPPPSPPSPVDTVEEAAAAARVAEKELLRLETVLASASEDEKLAAETAVANARRGANAAQRELGEAKRAAAKASQPRMEDGQLSSTSQQELRSLAAGEPGGSAGPVQARVPTLSATALGELHPSMLAAAQGLGMCGGAVYVVPPPPTPQLPHGWPPRMGAGPAGQGRLGSALVASGRVPCRQAGTVRTLQVATGHRTVQNRIRLPAETGTSSERLDAAPSSAPSSRPAGIQHASVIAPPAPLPSLPFEQDTPGVSRRSSQSTVMNPPQGLMDRRHSAKPKLPPLTQLPTLGQLKPSVPPVEPPPPDPEAEREAAGKAAAEKVAADRAKAVAEKAKAAADKAAALKLEVEKKEAAKRAAAEAKAEAKRAAAQARMLKRSETTKLRLAAAEVANAKRAEAAAARAKARAKKLSEANATRRAIVAWFRVRLQEHSLVAAFSQSPANGAMLRDGQRVQLVWNMLIVELAVLCGLVAAAGYTGAAVTAQSSMGMWLIVTALCGVAAKLTCKGLFKMGNAPTLQLRLPGRTRSSKVDLSPDTVDATGDDTTPATSPSKLSRVLAAWACNLLVYVGASVLTAKAGSSWDSAQVSAVMNALVVILTMTWFVIEPVSMLAIAQCAGQQSRQNIRKQLRPLARWSKAAKSG